MRLQLCDNQKKPRVLLMCVRVCVCVWGGASLTKLNQWGKLTCKAGKVKYFNVICLNPTCLVNKQLNVVSPEALIFGSSPVFQAAQATSNHPKHIHETQYPTFANICIKYLYSIYIYICRIHTYNTYNAFKCIYIIGNTWYIYIYISILAFILVIRGTAYILESV